MTQSLIDLWYGFGVALQPHNLMWSFFGVLVGNLIGVLPGMGALTAISMLLPLTYTMHCLARAAAFEYARVKPTAEARREMLAEVAPFLTNMPERFAWADLIVCRAGAITAAEIAAANLDSRREGQLGIVRPAPAGHRGDAELAPDLRVGHEFVRVVGRADLLASNLGARHVWAPVAKEPH